MMGQTLNPKSTVWTKWHQQRLVNQEMGRDLGQTLNQRYMDVRVITMPLFGVSAIDKPIDFIPVILT